MNKYYRPKPKARFNREIIIYTLEVAIVTTLLLWLFFWQRTTPPEPTPEVVPATIQSTEPAEPLPDPCTMEVVTCGDTEKYEHELRPLNNVPPSAKDHDVALAIVKIAQEKDFKWPDYLVRLAYCESRLNPKARNDNGQYGIDRGVFQINSFYHPDISDAQADDLEFATNWTINMINKGYQIRWACDKIVKHQKF